jgi:hypothetical protein
MAQHKKNSSEFHFHFSLFFGPVETEILGPLRNHLLSGGMGTTSDPSRDTSHRNYFLSMALESVRLLKQFPPESGSRWRIAESIVVRKNAPEFQPDLSETAKPSRAPRADRRF